MARVLTRSRKYDHITPILQSLHWLPIKFRISYKILLLTYKALNGLAPAYLTILLSRYIPTCSLRLQNSYLAPKLWNSLPDNCNEESLQFLLRIVRQYKVRYRQGRSVETESNTRQEIRAGGKQSQSNKHNPSRGRQQTIRITGKQSKVR